MANNFYSSENLYLANNNMKSDDLYYYRSLYKQNVLSFLSDKKIDLWYDIQRYGKVDYEGKPVFVSESNLKQITSEKTLFVIDFVADAYEYLRLYFERAIQLKKIKTSGPFSNLEAKNAWININNLYHAHVEMLYKMFLQIHIIENIGIDKIKTFEIFLKEFIHFFDIIRNSFPITKTSFILSRFCSPLTTGLMLEIDTKSPSDDFIKQKNFLKDENFIFFKNALKKFGFFIDKNIPYRIVADISSKQMRRYMESYGINNTNLFSKYYYRSSENEIDLIKQYLIIFWNTFVSVYPQYTERKGNCLKNNTFFVVTKRERFEFIENNEKIFNDDFWISYYFRLRLMEKNLNWKEEIIKKKIKDLQSIQKKLDKSSVINYIEKWV